MALTSPAVAALAYARLRYSVVRDANLQDAVLQDVTWLDNIWAATRLSECRDAWSERPTPAHLVQPDQGSHTVPGTGIATPMGERMTLPSIELYVTEVATGKFQIIQPSTWQDIATATNNLQSAGFSELPQPKKLQR